MPESNLATNVGELCGATISGKKAGCGPELTVIVPTFNERQNVQELIRRLDLTLASIHWEVVFVDDNSPDGTWMEVQQNAKNDSRVRGLRRVGRRGLAGACIEGILASSAPFACVIDGDLQHDETQIPKMLTILRGNLADLAVGSRYMLGGKTEDFGSLREYISSTATKTARHLLKVDLSDPLSGFFMIRRDRFDGLVPALSTHGFKILLDIIATSRGKLRTVEIPYVFSARAYGQSKLDSLVALDFVGLVIAKLSNDLISLRFVLFGLIGAIGLFVHLAALYIFLVAFEWKFSEAQVLAAVASVTGMFFLMKQLTYRAYPLRGTRWLRGHIISCIAWSGGLFVNVGVALMIFDRVPSWWMAGIAGSLLSAIWSYSMSNLLVWHKR